MKITPRPRWPLSVKIIAWFFLNLALLAAVMLLILNAQFRFDLNWVFVTSARGRVETMRNLIVDELNRAPTFEWQRVLERFSSAYGVRIGLFADDGTHLVGLVSRLPDEVQTRIAQRSSPPPRPPDAPNIPNPPLDFRSRGRGPLRVFMRTSAPARYWLLLSVRLD